MERKQLTLGIWKSKDLAEWFGVIPNYFSKNKKKKLEELKEYCSFEDLGHKGVKINEIYNAYYKIGTQEFIHLHFLDCWEEGSDCVRAATRFIKMYGNLGLRECTIITYFNKEKIKRFGKQEPHKYV